MSFKRPTFALGLACLLIASAWAKQPVRATENVVLQWNQTALQAVRNTRMGPPMVARALAIMHTSMFAAWAAYDPVAVSPHLGAAVRRPAEEHTLVNKEEAISFAAYRALVDLFPESEVAVFDDVMRALGYDPAHATTETSTPAGIGNAAAAAVLAFRHHDGANQLGDLNAGAYSDYTGYAPVNDPDRVVDTNRWQPLRLPDGQTQRFLVPHWSNVAPFALTSPSHFQPEPPAQFPSARFRKQAREVLRISATLGDREKAIAGYWADGPSTETPPGHWCLFAQFVSRRDGHDLDDDVRMFFALSNGLLDASIAVWDCKRAYDTVRPVTAIRFLFEGAKVRAWGGPFQGTQRIDGADWQPYIATPPFPEYVSGHSTFSAVSAEILKLFTGDDAFGASATIAAGSSPVEPGLVPASDVTLAWATFSEAAAEAGKSRRFGGIHFRDGDLQGRALGRRIGAEVWSKALTYFDGTVSQ
jgi:hypothetical protein